MRLTRALQLADYYGGDQVFEDERDHMSAALHVLARRVRRLEKAAGIKRVNLDPSKVDQDDLDGGS